MARLIKVFLLFSFNRFFNIDVLLFQNFKLDTLSKLCRQGYASQLCSSRCLSSVGAHLPVTQLTEDEQAIRDLAAKVSREKIAPLVGKMDRESKLDPSIIKALFENGVRYSK